MPATAPATAVIESVDSVTTAATLAAANADRKMLIIYNASTAVLYLKFGTEATNTDYSLQIPASGMWECPGGSGVFASGVWSGGLYTGIITGTWASVNGSAKVTEIS